MKEVSTFEELVDMIVNQSLINTHVALPAIVKSYNSDGSVEVVLTVKKIKIDREEFEIPPLSNIPVIYPGAGNFSVSFPLVAGDEGLVIVCERDISKFVETGNISPPKILRRHDLSDSVFIPSKISKGKRTIHPQAKSDSLLLKADTTEVEVKNDGNVKITGNLLVSGEVKARSEIPGLAVSLSTHLHPPDNTPPTGGT